MPAVLHVLVSKPWPLEAVCCLHYDFAQSPWRRIKTNSHAFCRQHSWNTSHVLAASFSSRLTPLRSAIDGPRKLQKLTSSEMRSSSDTHTSPFCQASSCVYRSTHLHFEILCTNATFKCLQTVDRGTGKTLCWYVLYKTELLEYPDVNILEWEYSVGNESHPFCHAYLIASLSV